MKGHWHFVAISATLSILQVIFQQNLFFLGLILWLVFLYFYRRLGKIPITVSLTISLIITAYIPTLEPLSNISTLPKQDYFTGKITGQVNVTEQKLDFSFQDESLDGKLLVIYFFDNTEGDLPPNINHGATCEIEGKLEFPNRSRNPGQFDYRKYLASQGITYQLTVGSLEDVVCEGSSFLSGIYLLRMKIQAFVNERYSEQTSAWLNALVLGNDSHLDRSTIELFQKWSLSHILAISGLHVGLIVALIYFLLIKLTIVTKEKAQWIMVFFLPIYAILAGGQPSVWRASVMVLFIIILTKTKIRYTATDIISIVFLLLIFIDKFIVYHIGFQLSFIVTFGLILSRKWISQTNSTFFQLFQISFIAQMMILPLQFSYFYSVQPLSIILNTLVVPYFSLFVIPLMFILLLISPIPVLPTLIDRIFVLLQHHMLTWIEFVDRTFYFPWFIGSYPMIMTVIYYGLLIVMMMYMQQNKLIPAFKYGFCLVITIMLVVMRPYFSPYGTVTMLDIGQGDAFIIELPYRRGVFFIDAGARFNFEDMNATDSIYKQILQPYLHSKGIAKIDAIFISHEDLDHMGSVDFLVEGFHVNKIIISDFYILPEQTKQLWQNNGVQIERTRQDDVIEINRQLFHVVAPGHNKNDSNENSVVIHTNIGGENWLFTGDIGKETERELIQQYELLPVDILKVAHHGSKNSTDQTFINRIEPAYALISVGEKNRYGHPTSEVLETLSAAGVYILRTDQDGAVIFRYKNNEGTFYKFLP